MWREGTSTADFADAVANVSHVTLPMDGADRVTIPDTELLFSAKYSRAGSDLVLTGADGHKLFVTGYFDHEKHADLVAPGGASLSADLVAKLTISQTPGQYAQAGAPAGGTVIGKVERLGGTATVQHANGTVEELHVGDAIYQGDVIETGGGSQLGLSLNDGTAFNMGASARMVLNELTYDTAGSANAGIFSLVRGSISFVAGQVAKNGDMRVETPVATMGIRGTTVNTTINADINGNVVSVTYSLMADPDGHIGSFNLLDKTTGAIIGTISATDTMFVITPSANLSVLAQQLDKTPEQVQQELAIAQMLFPIFLSNPANFLTNPNPNVNPNDLQPKKGAVGSGGYLDYQGHSTGLGDVAGLNVQTTLVNETVTVEIIRDNGGVPETVTQTVQVPLPNNFAPLITGDTPPHLKEAPSNFENGSTSVAQLTKSDIDGTATYDVAALLAAGWTDNHNGTFSKDGQYGTATLNTNTNTLTYQLDQIKADPLNVDDHPVEDFTIPVVDNQGATNSTVVSFTIDGANDAPTITASVNHHLVEASGFHLGVWTATATLTKGDVDGTASYDAAALSAGGWFSLGFGIYTKIGHYGLATLNTNTGKVTYLLDNFRANSLADGESVHDNFTVPVKDDSGSTGSTSVSFTIDGTNDNPVIFGKTIGFVKEDDACLQVATGQLAAVDFDHGATATWSVVGGACGTYGSIAIDASGKWTYTLDNDSTAVQALAQGETRFDTFTIKVTDDKGGIDTQIVKIKVTGTNDAPTVDAVVDHHLVEASGSNAGVWTATAALTKGDVDGTASYDTAALWSDGWVTFGFGIYFKLGNYGLATLDTHSGKVTYVLDNIRANALADGEMAHDDFTIPVKDDYGATASTTVCFTIEGTNDDPVIVGKTTDDVKEDGTPAQQTATGQLTAVDFDHGATATWNVVDGDGTYGSLTIDASGKWTYTLDNDSEAVQSLAKGQTRNDTFTVTVTDDKGGIDTQIVKIKVAGTNDAPVIGGATTGNVTEDGNPTTLTTSGVLTITDLDSGESNFHPQTHTAGTYGIFTLTANGAWTYTANNTQPAIQGLAADQSLIDSFTAVSHDGTQTTVTVTIHGANDVAYVADGVATPHTANDRLLVGSGIPDNHFGLAEQQDVGVELGLQVIYRQGPVVTTADDYGDGVLTFRVAEGAQSTANGSQTDAANRAAWNFDYSIATGLNGHSGSLADYTFKMMVDVDSTAATNYHTFEMVASPGPNATGFVWVDESVSATGVGTLNGHPIVIGDDAGNANIAQNSENYAFSFIQAYLTGAYASGFGGPGQFDIVLEASRNGVVLATNHIQVDVNAAPVFTGSAAGTAFIEGGEAVPVAVNVNASDADSANYNGGTFTASITSGFNTGDTLSIATNAYITATGGQVVFDVDGAGGAFNPISIGTVSVGSSSLTVQLNQNATDAAVMALAQAVQFSSTSSDPTNADRTVTFTLVDSEHGSDSFDTAVTVQPVIFVGGPHSNFGTIQEAIDAAHEGDTIMVAAGTYNEHLLIDKALTIKGASAGIPGNGTRGDETVLTWSSGDAISLSTTSQVTLDGFRFEGQHVVTASAPDANLAFANSVFFMTAAGNNNNNFYFNEPSTFSFTDNLVDVTGYTGAFFQPVGDPDDPTHSVVTITGNTFNGHAGTYVSGDDNDVPLIANLSDVTGSVSGNTFNNVDIGVLVANGAGPLGITGNTFEHMHREPGSSAGGFAAGVVFFTPAPFSGEINVSSNAFLDTDAGVRTSGVPGSTVAGSPIVIDGNTFTDVDHPGYQPDVGGVLHLTGSTVDGNSVPNEFFGGSDNDLIVGSSANDIIHGGAGVDTAESYSASATLAFANGQWTVTDGGATDTLTGVEKVVIGGMTYILVDHAGDGTGGFQTIQAAIDAASAGDTILVAAGTYANFVIDPLHGHGADDITIRGVGSVVIQGTFNADNGLAPGASVAQFLTKSTPGYNDGATTGAIILGSGVTLDNLKISGFGNGIEFGDALYSPNPHSLSNITLRDIVLSGNVTGINKEAYVGIDGLTISGGSISDGHLGINFAKNTTHADAAQGNVINASIDGTYFQHLTEKGIYVETLADSTITNVTMDDVGQFGRSRPFGSDSQIGAYGTGIDINLKNGDYQGIVVNGFTFTGVGASNGGSAANELLGAGISVKARDDGPTYGNAQAHYTGDVIIQNGTIDGTSTGIRAGEPGQHIAGPSLHVSGVIVNGESVADFDNVSQSVLTFIGTAGDDVLVASHTTTGPLDITGGDGNDIYYVGHTATIHELPGGGIDEVRSTESIVLADNVEKATLLDGASNTQTFDNMLLGAITNGENGWKFAGPTVDQAVVDDGTGNQVFHISSDPSNSTFGGPYSPGLSVAAGEAAAGAAYQHQLISFDFNAVNPAGDNSRVEVDFANAAGTDRNNFMVIESVAGQGIRIAVAEPTGVGEHFIGEGNGLFPTDWRGLVSGIDASAQHHLELRLDYLDGQANDLISIYLDGAKIGTTTTFELYRDGLSADDAEHIDNVQDNFTDRVLFRVGNNGQPQDGSGTGANQGFNFDNVTSAVYNNTNVTGNTLDNVITGNSGNNVLNGGQGNDTLTGGDGADTFVFAPNFGHDVITDFRVGTDIISIDHSIFASTVEVINAATPDGTDTVITAASGDKITLQNVDLNFLQQHLQQHPNDFVFV